METELLIMAHECHTAACNMEGISNVLRAARVCAQCLSAANQYQLMVGASLLCGVLLQCPCLCCLYHSVWFRQGQICGPTKRSRNYFNTASQACASFRS